MRKSNRYLCSCFSSLPFVSAGCQCMKWWLQAQIQSMFEVFRFISFEFIRLFVYSHTNTMRPVKPCSDWVYLVFHISLAKPNTVFSVGTHRKSKKKVLSLPQLVVRGINLEEKTVKKKRKMGTSGSVYEREREWEASNLFVCQVFIHSKNTIV